MTSRRTLLFTALLLLSSISTAVAQQKVIRNADTSAVEVRLPPSEKIQNYAQSEDFQYGIVQDSESIWDKISVLIWEQIETLLNHEVTGNFLELAFYLLIAFIIYLITQQLINGGVFRSQTKQPDGWAIEEVSDEPANLEPQIHKAIKNGQYNIAIGLLYKKSLTQLQNNGWINWQKNKTNHDYIYEIKHNELQHIFRDVTRYYEYAQYGNFDIGNTSFEKAHSRFKQMESIIKAAS